METKVSRFQLYIEQRAKGKDFERKREKTEEEKVRVNHTKEPINGTKN